MRQSIIRVIASLLLVVTAASHVAGQEATRKTHVFLIDVSLSMDSKAGSRYSGLKEWLVQPLLQSGAFGAGDKVIVRWFHERVQGGTGFSAQDVERKVGLTDFNEGVVLDHIPTPGQGYGQNTNIPQSLELVLSDINGYRLDGDVLIWLLTDNFQESGLETRTGASTNIKPLYQSITDNKNFRAAYLFPLVNQNNVKLDQGREAMILYLLHYSPKPSLLMTDELAGAVSKKINNPVITWFPIGKKVIPEPVPTEDDETQMNGDSWVLPSVPEGQSPNFDNIRFYLKSKLQSRAITGRIKPNPNLEIVWARSLAPMSESAGEGSQPGEGESGRATDAGSATEGREGAQDAGSAAGEATATAPTRWDVSISPSELALGPGMRSEKFYTVALTSPLVLRPDSFLTGLWNSESELVSGTMSFEIEDIRADVQVDDAALDRVANKEVIKQIISQSIQSANQQSSSATQARTFFLPIQFRVTYDSTWRWGVVVAIAAALLTLALALAFLLLVKTPYQLTTPTGERVLGLPLVGSAYLSVNGSRAAVISKRFGKLTIKPMTNYLIDGTPDARPLPENAASFVITSHGDGKSYSHSWQRAGKRPSGTSARSNDFFD